MDNYKEFLNPTLVIMVGISGSGKSTWIKENKPKWKNTIVVSTDQIRKDLSGDISNQIINSDVFQFAKAMIIHNLKKGKNVILDATNIQTEKRISFINDIEKEVDFKKIALVFYVSREEAKRRIKKDIENKIDRAVIPEEVTDSQYQDYMDTLGNLPIEGFKIVTSWNED
jgi:predicted kinase